VLAVALCLGCFEAHDGAGPGGGGGGPGTPSMDAGDHGSGRTIIDAGAWPDGFSPPPYTDLRGIPSEEAIAECGTIDGFVRCDECGQEACPQWTLCRDHLGVCVGRRGREGDSCSFTLLPGLEGRIGYPARPEPCAVRASRDGSPEEPFSGIAMPTSYCIEARDVPDLPPQKCVYPDGTEVVTGPPDEPCPGPEGSMLVCGGSCGEILCPLNNRCVGFSDTRAFGLCGLPVRCSESTAQELIAFCESFQVSWYPGDCACMLAEPQPVLPGEERTGFVVPADACQRYRSFYPEQVECRDEAWNYL
jgi:hypothetical protein